jgi:hypothetical protein
MRQMASALELYYNDNNGYPDGKDGIPSALIPAYIGVVPTSPTPVDAPCTDYNNTYWYQPSGTPTQVTAPSGGTVKVFPAYTYSFCLGADTGGVAAGKRILSPSGIDGAVPVNQVYSPANETDYGKKIENMILDALRQMPWDAQIRIESSLKNYGVDKHIDLPADFVDPAKNN